MIATETDLTNNLFTVCYSGTVTAADTQAHRDLIKRDLATMQPGFVLLADLTDLVAMDAACAPDIENVMRFANARGVSSVVRVIPDPQRDIGMQIMSRFHYGPEVQIITCLTRDEARRILFN